MKKIVLLCHKDVSSMYTASLMQRGYDVVIAGGGKLHADALKEYLACEGCLLLGNEDDLLEIVHHMVVAEKPVWRDLAEVP